MYLGIVLKNTGSYWKFHYYTIPVATQDSTNSIILPKSLVIHSSVTIGFGNYMNYVLKK